MSHRTRAVALTVLAALMLASMDAVGKRLMEAHAGVLVISGRFAVQALVLSLVYLPRKGWAAVQSNALALQLARGVTMLVMSLAFLLGLRVLPLAEATALLFLGPVIVGCAAPWISGTRVPRAMWVALALGFSGVLLLLGPLSARVGLAVALPLTSAACMGLNMGLVRRIGTRDPPWRTNLFSGLLIVALTAPLAWHHRTSVAWRDLPWLAAYGVLGMAGHHFLVMALRFAPTTEVAAVSYAQMFWATLIAWTVFGTMPNVAGLCGLVAILLSGMVVLRHTRL